MLKDYLAEKNESIYRIAKGSGLAYTTLNEIVLEKKNPEACSAKTLYRLSSYLQISMDRLYEIMTEKEKTKIVPAKTWAEAANKKYRFPVIIQNEHFDISRIYPLKQKKVSAIYNAVSKDIRITRLYVFGSSTTIKCNAESDIDIAVGLKEIFLDKQSKNEVSEIIENACDYDADILWLDRLKQDTPIMKNIERGVVLI